MAHRDPKYDAEYGAYLAGQDLKSIAKRLGVSAKCVSRAFIRRRFPPRTRWKTTEEDREVIKAMYRTGDYKMQELADAFGYVSYVSISTILKGGKKRKRLSNRRSPRNTLPAIKVCGYRECFREVIYTYCRPLHLRLERSERAKDKRTAENALIIYG